MASDIVPEMTTDRFDAEVLNSEVPVLVDFHATWCGPCKALAPQLDKMAEELQGKARVVKVDIDAQQNLAVKYGVQAVPTLLVFSKGEEVARKVGGGDLSQLRGQLESAAS